MIWLYQDVLSYCNSAVQNSVEICSISMTSKSLFLVDSKSTLAGIKLKWLCSHFFLFFGQSSVHTKNIHALTYRVRNASSLAFSYTPTEYVTLVGWCWLALPLSTECKYPSIELSKIVQQIQLWSTENNNIFKRFNIHFCVDRASSLYGS